MIACDTAYPDVCSSYFATDTLHKVTAMATIVDGS